MGFLAGCTAKPTVENVVRPTDDGTLVGYEMTPSDQNAIFVAAPSSIDQTIDTASIEDYILALPPFEFHEETVEQFAKRVRSARMSEKQNVGKSRDYLFVRSDGCAPSKVFLLDRARRTLTIRSLNWEPGVSDDLVTMRRVPGGWLCGPCVEIKRGDR